MRELTLSKCGRTSGPIEQRLHLIDVDVCAFVQRCASTLRDCREICYRFVRHPVGYSRRCGTSPTTDLKGALATTMKLALAVLTAATLVASAIFVQSRTIRHSENQMDIL